MLRIWKEKDWAMLVRIVLLDEKGRMVKLDDSKPREGFEAVMLYEDLQHKMYSSEVEMDKNAMCNPNN